MTVVSHALDCTENKQIENKTTPWLNLPGGWVHTEFSAPPQRLLHILVY